jgi:hypothetical protein
MELSKMECSIKALKSIVLGVFLLVTTTANAAIILLAVPSTPNAMPGDVVQVDIVIDGLTSGAADSLGAFEMDIFYDSAFLSVSGYTFESFLGDIELGEALDFSFGDDTLGTVNFSILSLLFNFELDALQPASFVLATIEFSVDNLSQGSSTEVGYDFTLFSDAFGFELTPSSITNAVISNNAVVGVSSPPITLLFLLLMLTVWVRRCRKSSDIKS